MGSVVRESGSSQAEGTTALALGRGHEVDYAAAFALAVSGDVSRSRALADDLARDYPEDTSVQFMYLPTLRALFALDARDAAAAIQSLQTASRFDLALGGIGFNGYFGKLYPIYVRGLAYLAAQQPAEAAAEFQRIVDHRSIVLVDPIDALARLQLARALALSGDTVKAKSAYDDLLDAVEERRRRTFRFSRKHGRNTRDCRKRRIPLRSRAGSRTCGTATGTCRALQRP